GLQIIIGPDYAGEAIQRSGRAFVPVLRVDADLTVTILGQVGVRPSVWRQYAPEILVLARHPILRRAGNSHDKCASGKLARLPAGGCPRSSGISTSYEVVYCPIVSRKLRSSHWFGLADRDGFIHRSWMKNQGFPPDVFDGRPVIGICNTWS